MIDKETAESISKILSASEPTKAEIEKYKECMRVIREHFTNIKPLEIEEKVKGNILMGDTATSENNEKFKSLYEMLKESRNKR